MVREYLYKNTSSKEYGFSTEVNYLYDVKRLLTNASIDGKSSLEYFALELLEEIWTWRDVSALIAIAVKIRRLNLLSTSCSIRWL